MFLGIYLGYPNDNRKADGQNRWTELPESSIDRMGRTRGVGSRLNEARFNVFDTRNLSFDQHTKFSIYTHVP